MPDSLTPAAADPGMAPVGGMVDFAGTVPPSGWLLADGSEVSRAGYPVLFSVIGTIYGAGDGVNTFNLPDARGRIAAGRGTHPDVEALGNNEGMPIGFRTPQHEHTVTFDGAHIHRLKMWGTLGGTTDGLRNHPDLQNGAPNYFFGDYTEEAGGHVHQVGEASGPVDAPAFITVNKIIRAA